MRIVADDLSGAAEMAGVAWRFGYRARVSIGTCASDDADSALAISTESRELPPDEAAAAVREVAAGISFKKVDSALRGNIRAEIQAALEASGKRKCVLVPCNPTLGRVVIGGRYYVRGVPLEQTEFGAPADNLRDLLADAATYADVLAHARDLDVETLPAGAADFLAAIFETRGAVRRPPAVTGASKRLLLVSGSASPASRSRLAGKRVFRHPEAAACAEALVRTGIAALAIAEPPDGPLDPRLLEPLCDAAVEVLRRAEPDAVWVEGGATAAALALRCGWREFDVEAELSPGVVALAPREATRLRFVVKPGSYPWPAAVV